MTVFWQELPTMWQSTSGKKAKQVDESCVEEANKLIGTYRAHLPSTEEIFMHPDLEKGKSFTVGGWIGETTRIR